MLGVDQSQWQVHPSSCMGPYKQRAAVPCRDDAPRGDQWACLGELEPPRKHGAVAQAHVEHAPSGALVPLAADVGDLVVGVPGDGEAYNGKADVPVVDEAPGGYVPGAYGAIEGCRVHLWCGVKEAAACIIS